jgi:hypothetical protein
MSIQDYIQTLQVRIDTLKEGDRFCINFHEREYTLTADPFPNEHYGDKTGLILKVNEPFDILTLPYGYVVYQTS